MAKLNQTINSLTYRTPFVVASSPLTDHVDHIKRAEECGAGAASLKLTMYSQPNKGIRQMYAERGFRFFNPSDKRNDLDKGLALMRRCKEATSEIVLWANIAGAGGDLDTWASIAQQMQQAGADGLELNFICPNMNFGKQQAPGQVAGAQVGKDAELVGAIVQRVKQTVAIPVMVKLTSEVEDYLKVARKAGAGGADGLVINASPLVAPPIDIYRGGKTKMATFHDRCSFGGCGGPVIRPLSYRLIAQVAQDMDIMIAGGGGLETWEHCVESLMFGSNLVTMCSKLLLDGFDILKPLAEQLAHFMDEYGYADIGQLSRAALPYICATSELSNTDSYAEIDTRLCTGCGMCARIGSCRAIEMRGGKAVADPTSCEGCGLCRHVCRAGAVAFIPRCTAKI